MRKRFLVSLVWGGIRPRVEIPQVTTKLIQPCTFFIQVNFLDFPYE